MSFGYRFPPLPQVLDDRPSPPRPNHLSQSGPGTENALRSSKNEITVYIDSKEIYIR